MPFSCTNYLSTAPEDHFLEILSPDFRCWFVVVRESRKIYVMKSLYASQKHNFYAILLSKQDMEAIINFDMPKNGYFAL